MTYKEAVKKLRLKMLMTQKEFAKLLDFSFATINRWETGKYVLTIKVRRKLQPYFEKYNIEVDALSSILCYKSIFKTFWATWKNGIIWHTQGSGKTALAAFSNRVIKDYFGHKKVVNTRFFFVVDRLDLLRQAKTEFENRGFYLSSLNVYQGIIKICSMDG